MPPQHPDIEPIAFLLGTWSGTGRGDYPTIEPFEYAETVSFTHIGKPFLRYDQRTHRINAQEAGMPLHGEAGYLRVGSGLVELVIAQPTGIVEIHEGRVDGTRLELSCRLVRGTNSAVDVTDVDRRITVSGDTLSYELWMTAVGQQHQFHIAADLQREA